MRMIKIVFGIAFLAFAGMAAVQIGESEFTNLSLREDLRDMASLARVRNGAIAPPSDEQLTDEVIRRAHGYGIDLSPDEVRVRRKGEGEGTQLHLAADYTTSVKLVVFSFNLHFTPSSDK